ncbi:MAG: glycoside hydrolase family 13 protein, partial [Clostridia bacterium]|nr:glycoside hydrolase family 13 protein [Clostridia bacterium]
MEDRDSQVNFFEFKKIKTDDSYQDASLLGAFSSDAEVLFIFATPRRESIFDVKLAVTHDGGKYTSYYESSFAGIQRSRDMFHVTLKMSEITDKIGRSSGLFFYRWEASGPSGKRYFAGEWAKKLTEYSSLEDAKRQLLVYSANFNSPESFSGGIVYQIFPDRFCRSGKCGFKKGAVCKKWEDLPSFPPYPGAAHPCNDFFGGDLYGVIEKLDYFTSLGVTAIYLNPVFESVSNHRYDTGDMLKVDESLGGDEALRSLIVSAEEKGIKVFLDGVFNHVGADSVYFNKYGGYGQGGAFNSKDSEYFTWFCFEEYPEKYKSWWGIDILPKVNCDNETYRSFIKERFLEKWIGFGVAGWRIDVADELSDMFLSFLRENVKKNAPDAILIGEVWEDASNKISYDKRREFLYGNELDGVMNYPLRDALLSYMLNGDSERLRYATEGLYRRYPKRSSDVSFNILGSHDTVRILTALGGEPYAARTNEEKSTARLSEEERATAKKRLKALYSIVCALPGVPVIFYGDEAGREGYGDPFCRATFPWGKEDKDLISYFKKEGAERRKEPLLERGLFEIVYLD